MARPHLILVVLTLLLAASHAAKRKPEQLVCAADYYARAMTTVRNLSRQGRGQPPLTCPADNAVAWLP